MWWVAVASFFGGCAVGAGITYWVIHLAIRLAAGVEEVLDNIRPTI